MTTAEMLRSQGRVQGRAQGRAEGRAEGRVEGRAEGRTRGLAEGWAEALVQVLTVSFGPLPEDVSRTVDLATGDQVQAWTARAVTAETLDQVFA